MFFLSSVHLDCIVLCLMFLAMTTHSIYLPTHVEDQIKATGAFNSNRIKQLIQMGLAAERGVSGGNYALGAQVVGAEANLADLRARAYAALQQLGDIVAAVKPAQPTKPPEKS